MKPFRAVSRSDSTAVERIRLGPDRKRVLSLDAAGSGIAPPESEPELIAAADWPGILMAAGFTRREARVFLQHFRHGVPVYKLHQELGCTPAEAARAYGSMLAKLRRANPPGGNTLSMEPVRNSRRLAYRARLHTGARPWALAELDNEFAAIMHEEKYIHLISQRDPREFQKQRAVCTVIDRSTILPKENTQLDLQAQLRAERVKLDRIVVQSGEARDHVDRLEAKLRTLQAELKQDSEEAILAEREPNSQLSQRAAAAEVDLASARERAVAYSGAVQRQRGVAQNIEDEIKARRNEAFSAEVAGPQRALNVALEQLISAAESVQGVLERYPDIICGYVPFPGERNDPLAHMQERGIAQQIFHQARHLGNYRKRVSSQPWKATA